MSGTMMEERLHELFVAQAATVQPSRAEWDDVIVDDLAEQRDHRRVWALTLAVAASVLLVVALGWVATRDGTHSPTDGARMQLSTDEVLFTAESVVIEVGGRQFTPTQAELHSDPNPTFHTLEIQWREHGVEMRLYFYFSRDETSWKVDEIRVYDGRPQGEWVAIPGVVDLGAEIGVAASGDLAVRLGDDELSARVVLNGFELQPYVGAARGSLPEPGGNPPPPVDQPATTTTTAP
ncbi:MAG: hypothetical protein Q8M22_04260 [Actinomycetota bacterium]|nr:hypothetical protein [Actinomycetota bacterium]